MHAPTLFLALGLLSSPFPIGGDGDPPGSAPRLSVGSDGELGGLVRVFYGFSSDSIGNGGGPDRSGIRLQDVSLYFEWQRAGLRLRTQAELATGGAVLEDAYVAYTPPTPGWSNEFRVGRFKPHVTRSATADPEDLVFSERTVLGASLDFYDLGLELSGTQDSLGWSLAWTNGSNGPSTEEFVSGRLEWSLYEGDLESGEGARGAPAFLRAELALFGFADASAGTKFFDGGALGGDFAMTLGPWSAHAEYAHLDRQAALPAVAVLGTPRLQLRGGGDPVAVTVGRRWHRQWQASLRWQTLDDGLDTDVWGLALNRFETRVPVVWTAEAVRFDSDGPDGWVLRLGVSLGASRPGSLRPPR